MRSVGRLTSALAVACLALPLTACGSSVSQSQCEGQWALSSMSVGGEPVGADELDALESMGLDISLALQEGGQAELVFLGETETGTWEATGTGCRLRFDDDELIATVNEDRNELVMTEDDQEVVFTRER